MAIALLSITIIAVMAAGKAEIKFENTKYDLGNIKEDGGPVTATYKLKNSGDSPLVIIQVTNGGCGCTQPDYPKEPIAPGKTAEIKIHFNPRGRTGEINRSVRVKSNGGKKELMFSGVILPSNKGK